MKAKELIKILKTDLEREIVISADSEGNRYSFLSDVSKAAYQKDKRGYEVDIGIEELTDELKKLGYKEEDVLDSENKCWVFYRV